MQNFSRETIRSIVRGAYDLQKMRIQTGNRLVANFKSRLGQAPSTSEEEAFDEEHADFLKDLRVEFDRITDGVLAIPTIRQFRNRMEKLADKDKILISDYAELTLSAQYFQLLRDETEQFKRLGDMVQETPLWQGFLKDIRGVGPAMAGVILSELDPYRAEYPSSFCKYAGLDVAPDSDGVMKGRSKQACHLVDKEYTNAAGEQSVRKSITFNPWLKTKLVGVLGTVFIKQPADKCEYRKIYDDYKHRLKHMDAHADKRPGHIHAMATRYMVKRFLIDLHIAWRGIEGLPVSKEYSEAKLGKVHKKAA